jgi:uncharacterized membrane protein (DUF373 family)
MDRERPRDMRPRDSAGLEALVGGAELAIYLVVAGLLVTAAALTLESTIADLIEGSGSRTIKNTGAFLLDRILLLLIFAELLYTLRLTNFGGRLLLEPFLFIGLIAVVRRVLVLTAEHEQSHQEVKDFVLEIGGLAGLALVLAVSIHLLRRSAVQQP